MSRSATDTTAIERRIHRIEHGLAEFTSIADMLRPDHAQPADPKTLTERMEYYRTPGVSIAVSDDCQIEWARAYGVMDANTGRPATVGTIFEAASTSKFVTAVMALHFVQEGLVDLDTDVNRHLKSWRAPENQFTKDEKVTLRRLLTHRAGLPSTDFSHDEGAQYPTLLDVLNGESPTLNRPAIPELVPGSRWQYSNVAYDVIQLLLEDIAGRPFQQIAREVVFAPLGMDNSSFAYPLDPEKKKHEAMPHDSNGISREPAMHLTAVAHAGLTTTPTDLARLTNEVMLSYQGKSRRILSQGMTRRLLSRECDIDPSVFGLPLSEGLGVLLKGEGKDLVFAHPGSNLPGLNCWLIGSPEAGKSVTIMTNGAKGEMLYMELFSAVNTEYDIL